MRTVVGAGADPACSAEEEDFAQTLGPLRGSSSPFSPLSRRRLNPIKPVYGQGRPDGRLNLTASAFNQLGQYASSPGRRAYCYAELAVFFPSGGRKHRQYWWADRLPKYENSKMVWIYRELISLHVC